MSIVDMIGVSLFRRFVEVSRDLGVNLQSHDHVIYINTGSRLSLIIFTMEIHFRRTELKESHFLRVGIIPN